MCHNPCIHSVRHIIRISEYFEQWDTLKKTISNLVRHERISNKKYLLKHIYDEVKEGIFDMINVRTLRKKLKEKMRDVYTILCLWSTELSKAFGLRNLCYSKVSVMMLLGYSIVGISRKYALRPNTAYLDS